MSRMSMTLKPLTLETFAKLFARALSEKQSFAFFLGAGCSLSSGVLLASTLTLRWIREMKRQDTGSSIDFETWYQKRHPDFTSAKAGSFYSKAFEELYPNVAIRRSEVQKFVSSKDPGFGYGALGAIMTSNEIGSLCKSS
jgi:hypothetical protein